MMMKRVTWMEGCEVNSPNFKGPAKSSDECPLDVICDFLYVRTALM